MNGENDGDHPAKPQVTSCQSMKDFKSAARWLNIHCILEKDEWCLQTSYSRANRLHPLGIINKHAAVKGMPALTKEEAETIAKMLLKERGAIKNQKQEETWQEEKLLAFPRPFYFKGELTVLKNSENYPTGRMSPQMLGQYWTKGWW